MVWGAQILISTQVDSGPRRHRLSRRRRRRPALARRCARRRRQRGRHRPGRRVRGLAGCRDHRPDGRAARRRRTGRARGFPPPPTGGVALRALRVLAAPRGERVRSRGRGREGEGTCVGLVQSVSRSLSMRKLNKKPRKKNMSTHQMCSSCAEWSWASCLRGGPPSPSTPSSRIPTCRRAAASIFDTASCASRAAAGGGSTCA